MANDFKVFAGSAGTNAYTAAAYAALSWLTTGVTPGVADGLQANTTWRQTSVMATVLAQFIVDESGQNAVDDGTTATLLANLKAGAAALGRAIMTGSDTGAVNVLAVALTPAPATMAAIKGLPITVQAGHTTTSRTVTLNVNTIGAYAVKNADGSLPLVGQIINGGFVTVVWDGTQFQIQSIANPVSHPPGPFIQATAGAWTTTVPAGATTAKVTMGGGGGGGAQTNGSQSGGGGGAGGIGIFFVPVASGDTLSGTIGAGGAAGTGGGGGSGGTGGNSTLLQNGTLLVTATGGTGGLFSVAPAGGAGGVITIGAFAGTGIALPGGYGTDGSTSSSAFAGDGAPGYLGMGRGRGASGGGTAANASAPCAGGGGAYGAGVANGGTGYNGFVQVEYS